MLSGVLNGRLCCCHTRGTLSHTLCCSGCPKRTRVMGWSQGLWSAFVGLRLCISLPPGRQPGQILIGSPLYCGCHCHHHSHWEGHTTSTPCAKGRMGAFGAIKLAMYTEHSREKATPRVHVSGHGGSWALEFRRTAGL